MNLLLDTHAVLWFAGDDYKIPMHTRKLIESPLNKKFVSIVSAWEIAIKTAKFPSAPPIKGGVKEFYKILEKYRFFLLPIEKKQLETVETLPFIHSDPFDRLIISQAINNNFTVITADKNIQKYNVEYIWDNEVLK
ncbi:MAG: type II toxin-antitoxin system VapC family toxin [Oscillospiraceae bacterium]|jgi:PIN domain nuclease of toxin-antitoxin system|nr:type II toxin-antitoxin system VapC family toxin [Oscillospiraceae bacterium]